MAETAKVIELKGDPKHSESAEHIIKFPGGSIAVCRTSDNEYWAHIEVNHGEIINGSIREAAIGEVVGNRLDYDHPFTHGVIPCVAQLNHLAVRIRTRGVK